MIDRYNSPEISDIWADYNKFKTYLEVELALLKALEGIRIPEGTTGIISAKAKIKPDRIKEIEAITKHDVIAFCTSITENLPPEIGKYFHFGCTSSDIIDTATTLQIKKSVGLILKQLENFNEVLLHKAEETKYLVCMGRSHGMNAEPMSFGQKFLASYAEFSRRYQELKHFYDNECTGQLSGAVGNYTVLTPDIEKKAIESLGLRVEAISTQVIPRDRIAKLFSINALIASALENLAVEIRHLHHSDINELYEGFSKGQKGSSIMPHKKNPISGENITGLARVIRSHLTVAHENIPLWHERDISHSSAERLLLPDNLGLVFYALRRMTTTVENLVFNTEVIQNKVLNNFIYLSSYVMHRLIEENNVTREEVYAVVQKASFEAKTAQDFITIIKESNQFKDSDFTHLASLSLTTLRNTYLKHVDTIFERVKKEYPLL
jgi:adenylosuccinate lyase